MKSSVRCHNFVGEVPLGMSYMFPIPTLPNGLILIRKKGYQPFQPNNTLYGISERILKALFQQPYDLNTSLVKRTIFFRS